MTDNAIIEQEVSTHHRWWITAPPNQDAYLFFLVRYRTRERDGERTVVESHYLTFTHYWQAYDEGAIIEPFMSMPGQVVSVLSQAEMFDRPKIAEAMREVCTQILMAVGGMRDGD